MIRSVVFPLYFSRLLWSVAMARVCVCLGRFHGVSFLQYPASSAKAISARRLFQDQIRQDPMDPIL